MLTLAIPVYNMISFLPQCMKTMLSQTSQDFEIILVDDGSTDGSADLCDNYAAQFPNLIRAVHKVNGGLSSARNAGIDAASGDFIIFPDPDDWVEPDYVQHLLELQKTHNADLVCTGYYVATGNGSSPASADSTPVVLSSKDAQKGLLLSPRLSGFAWNKLYRLDIIRSHSLRFLDDVGTTEDLDFVYRYLAYANNICYAPCYRTYHYYQRPGAATHSGFSKRKLESIRTYEKIISDCASWSSELQNAAEEEICVTAVNLLWSLRMTKPFDRDCQKMLLQAIRKHLKSHLLSNRYGAGRKIQALTAAVSPTIFTFLKNCAQK